MHGDVVVVVVVVIVIVVVIVVVVIVTVASSEYVRASSMRDVRPLNNAENSGKKEMKVDVRDVCAADGMKEGSKRR